MRSREQFSVGAPQAHKFMRHLEHSSSTIAVAAVAIVALLDAGFGTSCLMRTARAQEATLPRAVEDLLELPRLPAVAADPTGRYLLLVHQHGLLPIEQLRAPSVTVAGRRLDPRNGAPHAPIAYYGLTLVDAETGTQTEIRLPDDVTVGFPSWTSDGSKFAFTVTTPTVVTLWLGDPSSGMAYRLTDAPLNAALGMPCEWLPDNRNVLCRFLAEARVLRPDSRMDTGPMTDRDLVERFLLSQLEVVDAVTGEQRPYGRPAIVEDVAPSPSGRLVLVTATQPTYSPLGAIEDWHRRVDIFDSEARLLQSMPLRDAGEPRALKALHWQPNAPETVVWVERFGDEERVLTHAAPFLDPATAIYSSPERFAGIEWLDGSSRALVSEYDADHRITRTWLVDAARPGALPRRVGSRSVDAAYPALGRRLSRTNATGHRVVRVRQNAIFTVGRTDRRSYVELLDLNSMGTQRIWESGEVGHERVVEFLSADGDHVLTQFETASEPPNYRLYDLAAGTQLALTNRAHPAPELARVERIPLRYRRDDGVELSSTLYVPRGSARTGTLPLLVWAYPRRYGYGIDPVGATSTDRFPDPETAFKLSFVLSGYAVLDDVSMPIVGNFDDTNDTFVEQVIANADAALQAAARTGYTDPERAGIAGHSYGAFMVANLLAHSDLFAAGIAMSGAYNRTLTPFGFQTERRSLWQARDAYLRMSPYLYSDQIVSPLLLIHGSLDDNAGTPPTQSQQLYDAIRYNGGNARLILLPYEGHAYRARSSVFMTARAMLDWLDSHLGRPRRFASFSAVTADEATLRF